METKVSDSEQLNVVTKNEKFIAAEVLDYMRSRVVKNSYDIVSVAQMMPTLEGFLTPYLVSELDGCKFDVSIEYLYDNSEDYVEFYETMVVEITKSILEQREETL